MPKFEAQVLGGFAFNHDGGDVKGLHAERLMLFLSYLLVNYNSTPTRKQISFLFWADSTEEQARTNLRNILHHLRKALPELDSILEVDTQFICLRSDADLSLDVRSFKSALAFAKASKNDAERIAHLQEAVSQYRGELLPGFYDDWILAAREECHQAYANALFELSKLHEDARQYTDAIQAVNRLLRVDALNESAYLQLMRLHALNDDRAGALQVYHTCSTVLMRELGVEPSQDIKRLYEQLVRSEEMPDGESGKSRAREAYQLIGRKQEWGRLREAWTSIQKGKAGMFIISGEAGLGKSRLGSELVQWTKRQGVVTAFAQCYPMEDTLSFSPVVAWLRTPEIQNELGSLAPLWKKELARLLPELESGVGEAGEKKWQKQRLFEAVAKGLLGSGKPRLLVLDDAQWSDQ
ncbi:MAG TPA: BTAD domain-containing putative transcriptional regulator, partial [Anaerolineales bacterium]|nr:BTAD domain-containing putative transcriptional regulator [Anaerolineales bacterium]